MIITDEAKVVVTEMLEKNGHDCLQASLQKGCCGSSLYFTFTNLKTEDKPVTINGISVLMNEDAEAKAATVTMKTNDEGELLIEDASKSSGCC
ncbi:hypothetical protein GH810_02520 [Acetobacterium paludosum]|uniref:Adhesin n=2 Tax=Acetobacterium TaxID=33951 RepID=A0A923KRE5_9FIRM|nr:MULTISPECIES: hypothetical protein [Acetobacterium]MBC3797820.1 hypothetical protein [Acetobacterium tundrae]MBC3887182.1 hypothetical protein [Acetobacterium paludosum]